MNLTDEELLLLNNLIYAVSVYERNNPSEAGMLSDADMSELLAKARVGVEGGVDVAYMSDGEWSDVFAAIESNERLMSLDLAANEYDPRTEHTAMCFVDRRGTASAEDDQAYVVFMGTGNHVEWKDNVTGGGVVETDAQRQARKFIEGLPYDGIVVSGHSKGGNKAQYVTITDEEGKISRCVTYDAQGFSKAFVFKHADNIDENAGKITAYATEYDYVNVLLYEIISGANYRYVEANEAVGGFAEYHCPNAFFVMENGEIRLTEMGDFGGPDAWLDEGSAEVIRSFTVFLLNTASEKDLSMILEFVGNTLGDIMGGAEGKTEAEILLELLEPENSEALIATLSYIMRYADAIGEDAMDSLLDVLKATGAGDGVIGMVEFILKNPLIAEGFVARALSSDVVQQIIAYVAYKYGIELTPDTIERFVMCWVAAKGKSIAISYDSTDFITPVPGTAQIRDFTTLKKEELLSAVESIHRIDYPSLHTWGRYSGEEWYFDLGVNRKKNALERCFDDVLDEDGRQLRDMNRVFNREGVIDSKCGRALYAYADRLSGSASDMERLANGLGKVSPSFFVPAINPFLVALSVLRHAR